MIDWKKSYEELRSWIIKLRIYCDNCSHSDNDECDECNRKAMGWDCDPKSLPKLVKGE